MKTYRSWVMRYEALDSPLFVGQPVGVVVGRPGEDWTLRRLTSTNGLGRSESRALTPHFQDLERRLRDEGRGPEVFDDRLPLESWLEQFAAISNGVLRVDAMTPVLAASAEEGAAFLFEHLVSVGRRTQRSSSRTRVRDELGAALRDVVRGRDGVQVAEPVSIGSGLSTANVDFALTGTGHLELAHAWSFDYKDAGALSDRIGAWTLMMGRIRRYGGQLTLPGGVSMVVEPTARIDVVHDMPRDGEAYVEHRRALAQAVEVWGDVDINVTPIVGIDRLVGELRAA